MRWLTGLLLCSFLFLVNCTVIKDVFKKKQESERTESSSISAANRTLHYDTAFRFTHSGIDLRRITTISIEGHGSITVSPSGEVSASGDGLVFSETEEKAESGVSFESTGTIGAEDQEKKETKSSTESQSEEHEEKKVRRRPNIIPWVGAGIAVSIIIFSVLYFIRKKIQFPTFK